MRSLETGILALADGSIFEGVSVGKTGFTCGEVVFNTAQTGYQEVMTDPSYYGQLITFTQPHIGNVGINAKDMESKKMFTKGIIMRSFSETPSNWRSEKSLGQFFDEQNVIAISEIDTRALTRHLRKFGSQPGCLMTGEIDIQKALDIANSWLGLSEKDLTQEVGTDKIYTWHRGSQALHSIVIDFGVKHSILNCLAQKGFTVTVVPPDTSVDHILTLKPDGVVLSNGPGDPSACLGAMNTIQHLLKYNIPLMGICLGHQLLALASGASTQKMQFGHHGANHPIQSLKTGEVFISSQNHGFVVKEENLPACLNITHRSLFDGTIAGIERTDKLAFGFQGHPEAGPGPIELTCLFDQFKNQMEIAHAQA